MDLNKNTKLKSVETGRLQADATFKKVYFIFNNKYSAPLLMEDMNYNKNNTYQLIIKQDYVSNIMKTYTVLTE